MIPDIQKMLTPLSFPFPGFVAIFSFDKEITAILDIAFTVTTCTFG